MDDSVYRREVIEELIVRFHYDFGSAQSPLDFGIKQDKTYRAERSRSPNYSNHGRKFVISHPD